MWWEINSVTNLAQVTEFHARPVNNEFCTKAELSSPSPSDEPWTLMKRVKGLCASLSGGGKTSPSQPMS